MGEGGVFNVNEQFSRYLRHYIVLQEEKMPVVLVYGSTFFLQLHATVVMLEVLHSYYIVTSVRCLPRVQNQIQCLTSNISIVEPAVGTER